MPHFLVMVVHVLVKVVHFLVMVVHGHAILLIFKQKLCED